MAQQKSCIMLLKPNGTGIVVESSPIPTDKVGRDLKRIARYKSLVLLLS
jgi:hypothetical protein